MQSFNIKFDNDRLRENCEVRAQIQSVNGPYAFSILTVNYCNP